MVGTMSSTCSTTPYLLINFRAPPNTPDVPDGCTCSSTLEVYRVKMEQVLDKPPSRGPLPQIAALQKVHDSSATPRLRRKALHVGICMETSMFHQDARFCVRVYIYIEQSMPSVPDMIIRCASRSEAKPGRFGRSGF